MKKHILLTTATLLTATCLGGNALPVNAASPNCNSVFKYENKIIISNFSNPNANCNINELLEELLQCKPSQTPCPPAQTPDTQLPENNVPETETPDNNIPETNLPENNVPETETPDNNMPEIESQTPSYIEQVVNLVNAERAKEGLAPLSIDENVRRAAQIRAVECEQSFSHTRPNGSNFATALKEQNVFYRRAGENIAWGQRSPEEVVNAWMNSPGHRANIMNANFTKIGVGYYQNANGINFWSQLFIG